MRSRKHTILWLLLVVGVVGAVISALLIVRAQTVAQVRVPAAPTERDFPMSEVLFSAPSLPAVPRISAQEAAYLAVRRVIGLGPNGDEPAKLFWVTTPAYQAELRDFSFNPALPAYPKFAPRLVWAVTVEGVPGGLPCGPGATRPGMVKECPQTFTIKSVVDATSGEVLHGVLESAGPTWRPAP